MDGDGRGVAGFGEDAGAAGWVPSLFLASARDSAWCVPGVARLCACNSASTSDGSLSSSSCSPGAVSGCVVGAAGLIFGAELSPPGVVGGVGATSSDATGASFAVDTSLGFGAGATASANSSLSGFRRFSPGFAPLADAECLLSGNFGDPVDVAAEEEAGTPGAIDAARSVAVSEVPGSEALAVVPAPAVSGVIDSPVVDADVVDTHAFGSVSWAEG